MDDEKPTKESHYKPLVSAGVIAALAIAYYFVIALPNQNKAKLDFQKQQYQDEQKAQQDAASEANQQKLSNQIMLNSCLDTAQTNYDTNFNLNSYPSPTNANARIWNNTVVQKNIQDALQQDKDNCFKQYPQN